ncbi:hypothetical protein ES703_94017 [subsurface metagenome]
MLGGENGMVDGIMPSADIQGACVGYKWFCFQCKQLVNQSFNARGRYMRVVITFADVNLDSRKIVFLKAACESACLEQRAGLFGNHFFAVINKSFDKIYFRRHKNCRLQLKIFAGLFGAVQTSETAYPLYCFFIRLQ